MHIAPCRLSEFSQESIFPWFQQETSANNKTRHLNLFETFLPDTLSS